MSAVEEIMQQIPLGQLASQLGTDEQTAGAAVQQAIPALLGGLQANAQDPAGAASLEGALGNHSAGLIDGGVDLSQVDADDGRKIVGNIFGSQADGVAQTLGSNLGGVDQSELVKRLLPLLAPIVMSYVAKRMGGGAAAGAAAAACSTRCWAGLLVAVRPAAAGSATCWAAGGADRTVRSQSPPLEQGQRGSRGASAVQNPATSWGW